MSRLIGQGAFGRTFQATDEHRPSKPIVIVKEFFPSDQSNGAKSRELFLREASVLELMGNHPQIPELFACFKEPSGWYLVQSYVDGYDLTKYMTQASCYNEGSMWHFLSRMISVLSYVHSKKVIHRDIKPANIMQRKSNGDYVLIDFGASRNVDEGWSESTMTCIGSAGYSAPEVGTGTAYYNSDIYSLGATCEGWMMDDG